jgi:hypothetical protein
LREADGQEKPQRSKAMKKNSPLKNSLSMKSLLSFSLHDVKKRTIGCKNGFIAHLEGVLNHFGWIALSAVRGINKMAGAFTCLLSGVWSDHGTPAAKGTSDKFRVAPIVCVFA